MSTHRVIVIGAGMGGLAAAVDLARQGARVTVLERAAEPGGKMRALPVGPFEIDAGPTVFTMRWVFEELFADAGTSLASELDLESAEVLARHAWRQGGTLDLHADPARSTEAVAAFAGATEARGFERFMDRSREVYRTLVEAFIASEKPQSSLDLVSRLGLKGVPALARTRPTATLWGALGDYFRDPRLRQLFGRYATYVGASPLLAPATLMLIANVEQEGVWRVRGGMRETARALARLAAAQGAEFRYGADVARILAGNGRARGVELVGGERLEADAVVFNGDTAALAAGLLGPDVEAAVPPTRPPERSLSAVTWCMAARTSGFDLTHHNVFFSEDYPREFEAIFDDRRVTEAPTVYLCAQARPARAGVALTGEEPLLALVNAPADGDVAPLADADIEALESRAAQLMAACGLTLEVSAQEITGPTQFEALFPGTGGALYGRANHGPFASFERPGTKADVPGLYLAGGSVHPGAGVPMATLSGRLAAARLAADRTAQRRRSAVSVFSPRALGD